MPVKPLEQKGGGLMGSPAVSAIMGYFTGGLSGAATGLLKSKNPAIGQAVGMIGGSKPETTPTVAETSPTADSTPYNPMKARASALSSDPQTTVLAGLEALNHPSVPQDMRDAYAEPLLRAKHYGFGRETA